MSWKTLRSERGQTAAEYMGILLLVAVIIGALVQTGVAGKIANGATDMVQAIAGGGKDNPNGSGNPGGTGNPGGSGNPGGTGNPGGSGNPGGAGNPGGSGNPGGQSDEEKKTLLCLSSGTNLSACLTAAAAPNRIVEGVGDRAKERLMKAQKKLYNTARPGTPEFEDALAKRNAALKDYLKSRAITNNKILKPLSELRKGLDPRYKDLKAGLDAVTKGSKDVKGAPLAPNTASGGPVKPSAGAKVLGHLGKLGKGLGIAGTALGLYNNINKDGTAKGITETAVGTAAAYGTGAAIAAGCTAVGVATAGVGGLVCAGVAFGGSYLAGKYGTQLGGWAYDRGADAVNAVNDQVVKPVSGFTKDAAGKVVDGGEKVLDGGKKVIGALNPFG